MTITVHAGDHPRVQCPVSVALGGRPVPPNPVLEDVAGGQALPCQVDGPNGGGRLHAVIPELARGGSRTYRLGSGPAAAPGVCITRSDGETAANVTIGGEAFTCFHWNGDWARPFLHPLNGPYGAPVTRAYPVIEGVPGETADHPHHKSFWVAWGDVNGSDNWSEAEGRFGRTTVSADPRLTSGPAFGRIAADCVWLNPEGDVLMTESRTLTFHNQPSACRAIDLAVTLRASHGPVRFGDTKEGGICSLRVASSMDASGDGTIVNSFGGTNEAETWGKRAHWCDYVGPVDGRVVGLAILDHDRNPRHPTYWHVRNYGLMTANPFGVSYFSGDRTRDGSVRMAAGTSLTFRYRVLVHAGTTEEAAVADRYIDYIHPPGIEVEA